MASSALRRKISIPRISAAFGNSNGSRNRRMSSSTSRDESCPWLMLPPRGGGGGGGNVYKYYSLVEKRVVSTQTNWREECGGEWEFVGSSHGWLSLFDQRTNRLFLSSPISGRLINLPPVPERSIDEGRRPPIVSKVILSPSPSVEENEKEEEECRAVMTFGPGNSMAFCSPFASSGFPHWDRFGHLFFEDLLYQPDQLLARVYEDLVYCQRRRVLTCITPMEFDLDSYNYSGGGYICELENWDIHHPQLCNWEWDFTPTPEVARLSMFLSMINGGGENTRRWGEEQQHCIQIPHLVYAEELDQLYLVMRLVALIGPDGRHLRWVPHCRIRGLMARYPCQTVGFVVLKVFQAWRLGSYKVVDDLDGLAMFVGVNHSFALPASRFPELKPDTIYFTDAKRLGMLDGAGDTGVFDYANKTISPIVIPPDDDGDDVPPPSSSPIWFYPPTA